jgi:hypothetical protein
MSAEPCSALVLATIGNINRGYSVSKRIWLLRPSTGVRKPAAYPLISAEQSWIRSEPAQPARRAAEIVVTDVEPQVPDRFAIDPLLGKTVSDNDMVDRNRLTPDAAKAPFERIPCFPEVGCNDGVSVGRRSASSGHLLVMKRRKPRIIDGRGLPGALMVARQR